MNNDFKFFIIGIIIVGAILGLFVLNFQAPTGFFTGVGDVTTYSAQLLTASSDRYVNPNDPRTIVREDKSSQVNVMVGDINNLLPLTDDNIFSVGWNKLTGFPAGCPSGQAITNINTMLTCKPFLTSYTETDPIYSAEKSTIVFENDNISRLTNDAGYITSYTDTNCELYGSCGTIVYWQDANIIFLKQTDANDWFVLKDDFNVLGDARYYQKTDFNYLTFITSADLSDYLKEVDANNIYAFKTDLKDWVLWTDANNTFYKQTDFNYLEFLTSYTDTNWQTSWALLDANLSATYYPLTNPSGFISSYIDTNLWTAGLLNILNVWQGNLEIDGNVTADYFFGDGSNLTGLFSETDANALYVPYTGATKDINLGDYNLSANTYGVSSVGKFYIDVNGDWVFCDNNSGC